MAQRISRAKRTVAESGPARAPDEGTYAHASPWCSASSTSSSTRATRPAPAPTSTAPTWPPRPSAMGRLLHELVPDEPEASGLLALMLLTEARRPPAPHRTARSSPSPGRTAPMDRARSSRRARTGHRRAGRGAGREYALQAAVAALHDAAPARRTPTGSGSSLLYSVLETMSDNPVMWLDRAVAVAMVEGPDAGLVLLDDLSASGQLRSIADVARPPPGAHRRRGRRPRRVRRRGGGTDNLREREYLTAKAAARARRRLTTGPSSGVVRRCGPVAGTIRNQFWRVHNSREEPPPAASALRKGDDTRCAATSAAGSNCHRRSNAIIAAACSSPHGSSWGASWRTQPRARRPS